MTGSIDMFPQSFIDYVVAERGAKLLSDVRAILQKHFDGLDDSVQTIYELEKLLWPKE